MSQKLPGPEKLSDATTVLAVVHREDHSNLLVESALTGKRINIVRSATTIRAREENAETPFLSFDAKRLSRLNLDEIDDPKIHARKLIEGLRTMLAAPECELDAKFAPAIAGLAAALNRRKPIELENPRLILGTPVSPPMIDGHFQSELNRYDMNEAIHPILVADPPTGWRFISHGGNISLRPISVSLDITRAERERMDESTGFLLPIENFSAHQRIEAVEFAKLFAERINRLANGAIR